MWEWTTVITNSWNSVTVRATTLDFQLHKKRPGINIHWQILYTDTFINNLWIPLRGWDLNRVCRECWSTPNTKTCWNPSQTLTIGMVTICRFRFPQFFGRFSFLSFGSCPFLFLTTFDFPRCEHLCSLRPTSELFINEFLDVGLFYHVTAVILVCKSTVLMSCKHRHTLILILKSTSH